MISAFGVEHYSDDIEKMSSEGKRNLKYGVGGLLLGGPLGAGLGVALAGNKNNKLRQKKLATQQAAGAQPKQPVTKGSALMKPIGQGLSTVAGGGGGKAKKIAAGLAGGTAVVGTAVGAKKLKDKRVQPPAVPGAQPVTKSDMVSAFGITHGAIYKSREADMDKKGYRQSSLSGMNSRSDTYVKRGTGVKRVALPFAAGVAGGAAGGAVGDKIGGAKGRAIGTSVGAWGGGSAALSRNIRSGDTAAYHRKTGKKAKAKVGTGRGVAANIY